MDHERCGRFRLEYQLVGQLAFDALRRIALIVVDSALDHPVVVEDREATGLIEKSLYVLVGAVRFELAGNRMEESILGRKFRFKTRRKFGGIEAVTQSLLTKA